MDAVPITSLWRSLSLALPLALVLHAHNGVAQLSTADHLAEPGFWPTQDSAPREAYVGPEACGRCHTAKAASQMKTPMGRNLTLAGESDILHAHPQMSFRNGSFKYQIETSKKQSTYSIKDGTSSLSFPLFWAFGTGRVGQSYLFKKQDGEYYEARVTYFDSLGDLGATPFRALLAPKSIEEAMYRHVDRAEITQCFACHATASSMAGHFDESHLIPGVTCEACHGPGAKHISSMEARIIGNLTVTKPEIFNSGRLTPIEAVEFCGACHGAWWDVKLSGVKGVSTTRSAPYRLVTSKCWGKGDARLTCSACHDPHEQLQTTAAAYDKVCLGCHTSIAGTSKSEHSAIACKVGDKNCTSCHMPKILVPEMHDTFTDHRIRVVHAGEAFPD